ncbi:MAG: hypothetical protein AB1798_08315, partial [Spirochaetota bacterium]
IAGPIRAADYTEAWSPLLKARLGIPSFADVCISTGFKDLAAADYVVRIADGLESLAVHTSGAAGEWYSFSDLLHALAITGTSPAGTDLLRGLDNPGNREKVISSYIEQTAIPGEVFSTDNADRAVAVKMGFAQKLAMSSAGKDECIQTYRETRLLSPGVGSAWADFVIQEMLNMTGMTGSERAEYILDSIALSGLLNPAAAIHGMGPGSEVFTKALYAGLYKAFLDTTGDLTKAGSYAGWVFGLTPLKSGPKSGDIVAEFLHINDPVRKEAFFFNGSAETEAYFLKRAFIRDFKEIPGDYYGFTQGARDELKDFAESSKPFRQYISGLDGYYSDYLSRVLAGKGMLERRAASAAMGIGLWYDPMYTARMTAQGQEYLSYLSSLENNDDFFREAGKLLSSRYESAREKKEVLVSYRGLIGRMKDFSDKKRTNQFNYRKFITASYYGTDNDAPKSVAVSDAAAEDGSNGLVYFSGSPNDEWINNYRLALHNDAITSINFLNTRIGEIRKNGDLVEADSFAAYFSSLAKAAEIYTILHSGGRADSGLWNELIENGKNLNTDIRADVEWEYAAKGRELGVLQSKIAMNRSEIGRLGSVLDRFNDTAIPEVQKTLPYQEKINFLKNEYKALDGQWDTLTAGFGGISDEYNERYTRAKGKLAGLDTARFNLNVAEEILEFALSGYLKGGDTTWTGGMETQSVYGSDPAEKLAFAQEKHRRALAAYDALQGLFSDDGPEKLYTKDAVYKQAFDDYKACYKKYLMMEKISGVLAAAIETQQRRVDEQQAKVDKDLEAVWQSPVPGPDLQKQLEIWNALFGGIGLGNPVGDIITFTGYFESEGDPSARSFHQDRRRWADAMLSFKEGKDTSELFRKWGLAFSYLMHSLYMSPPAPGVRDQEKSEALESNYIPLSNVFNQQQLVQFAKKKLIPEADTGYLNALLSDIGKKALDGMGSEERRLFDTFVMAAVLGSARFGSDAAADLNFMTESGICEVLKVLQKAVGPHIEELTTKIRQNTTAALSMHTLAMAFSWLPGLSTLFFQVEIIFWAIVLDESTKKRDLEEISTDIGGNIAGRKGRIDASAHYIAGSLDAYRESNSLLIQATEKLNRMKCTKQNGTVSTAELATAVMEAFGVEGEALTIGDYRLDGSTIKSYLDVYGSGLSGEERRACTDSTSMVGILKEKTIFTRDARREVLEKHIAVKEGEQRERLSAYGGTYNGYIQSTVTLDQVMEAAVQTFQETDYSAKEYLGDMWRLSSSLRGDIGYTNNAALSDAQNELTAQSILSLKAMYADRLANYLKAREAEWETMLKDLRLKHARWDETNRTIVSRGRAEWDKAGKRFLAKRDNWAKTFENEYRKKSGLWERKYLSLELNKKAWLSGAASKAVNIGSRSVLKELGVESEAGIKAASARIISGLQVEVAEPETIVRELMDSSMFGSLLKMGAGINKKIGNIGTEILARLGGDGFETISVLSKVRAFEKIGKEEIERHIAEVTSTTARDGLEQAKQALLKQVEAANKGVDHNLKKTFINAGFKAEGAGSGTVYTRETITSATVVEGVKRESHRIDGYKYFVPEVELDPGVDLSEANLRGLSAEGIYALMDKGIKSMEWQIKKMLGDGRKSILEETSFEKYVGKAPDLVESPDPTKDIRENVRKNGKGSGELGRVLLQFYAAQLKEGKGWEEFNTPVYDRKLWDDEGELIKAPTIRGIIDVGISAAAMVAFPGGGALLASTMFNLADDALFTMLEVGDGQMAAGEGLAALGKKAAMGMVSAGLGVVGKAAQFGTGLPGVVSRTMWTGVSSLGRNVAGGLLNSITYTDGKLGFDDSVMRESVVGGNVLAEYVGGMAGALVSSGLGAAAGPAGNKLFGGTISLAGNAAGTAARYGFHLGRAALYNEEGLRGKDLAKKAFDEMGGVTFNLVNLGAMFDLVRTVKAANMDGYGTGGKEDRILSRLTETAEALSGTGLLEWKITSGSSSLNLGMGGMDLGGSLYNLGKTGVLFDAIGKYAKENNKNTQALFKTAYGYGDLSAEDTVWRLLSGKDRLHLGLAGAAGETELDRGGGRSIFIGDYGDRQEDMLREALTLQHEAHRNGIDDGILGQKAETYRAAKAHTEIAMRLLGKHGVGFLDGNLINDINHYLQGSKVFAGYAGANYDSSADYWRLTKDGKIEWDGKLDLSDWNGNLLIEDTTESMSRSLVRYIGLDRAQEILKKDLSDLDLYDDQTLKDVTGYTRQQLKALGAASKISVYETLALEQKQKLAGEALMKGEGMKWTNRWENGEGRSFMLTEKEVEGQIYMSDTLLKNGEYEKFTVSADVWRHTNSYRGKIGDGKNQRLDEVLFMKRDLDGNVISQMMVNKVQTVDIMLKDKSGNNLDQSYNHPL